MKGAREVERKLPIRIDVSVEQRRQRPKIFGRKPTSNLALIVRSTKSALISVRRRRFSVSLLAAARKWIHGEVVARRDPFSAKRSERIARDSNPPERLRALNPCCSRMRVA